MRTVFCPKAGLVQDKSAQFRSKKPPHSKVDGKKILSTPLPAGVNEVRCVMWVTVLHSVHAALKQWIGNPIMLSTQTGMNEFCSAEVPRPRTDP